jgi:hypothetical protein
MSILNLIDGSYGSNAPIDVQNLSIQTSTYDSPPSAVILEFSKVGNICTLKIEDFISHGILKSRVDIHADSPEIIPFKPNSSFLQDFAVMQGSVMSWGTLNWKIDEDSITITTSSIIANIALNNSEQIIYNIL